MTADLPILYSFRRCPYAMRARHALLVAGRQVILREVILSDKPAAMTALSGKGTVPVLQLTDGTVIDESVDVMLWALDGADPESWLAPAEGTRGDMMALVDAGERDFKPHLDRYKYAARYEGADPDFHHAEAEKFLAVLEIRLADQRYLFGDRLSFADVALAPFIRQFAFADRARFDASPYPAVRRWLDTYCNCEAFSAMMPKYAQWHPGDETTLFPGRA